MIPERRRRPTSLTLSYLLALVAIILLCTLSLVMLARVIAAQHDDAAIIDAAERERMLVQRVAVFAEQINYNQNEPARGHVLAEAAAMLKAETALTQGNGDLGIQRGLSAPAQALYFNDPVQLDRRIRAFAASAQKLGLSHDPIDEAANYRFIMDDAAQALVPALNQAVQLFLDEANGRAKTLRTVQALVLALMLLALAAIAIPFFRPRFLRSIRLPGSRSRRG